MSDLSNCKVGDKVVLISDRNNKYSFVRITEIKKGIVFVDLIKFDMKTGLALKKTGANMWADQSELSILPKDILPKHRSKLLLN